MVEGRKEGRKEGRWMDGRMDGWTQGWRLGNVPRKHRLLDVWTDGRLEGWMEAWKVDGKDGKLRNAQGSAGTANPALGLQRLEPS